MTDVIKIALQRRAELSAELNRLDDFIRMAETLVQDHGQATAKPSTPPNAAASSPATNGGPAEPASEGPDQQDVPLRSPGARPTVFRQKAHG
ncbi:MAG: hypothetical protein AAGI13_02555 [Pseudomonadota bacterium]